MGAGINLSAHTVSSLIFSLNRQGNVMAPKLLGLARGKD